MVSGRSVIERSAGGGVNAVFEQIKKTYRLMADKARYRPAAPSDGCGNIAVAEQELNLEDEVSRYANSWWKEEDNYSYWIGCCNFETRPATILAVEAARQMCGGMTGNATALKLLKLAVEELEAVE